MTKGRAARWLFWAAVVVVPGGVLLLVVDALRRRRMMTETPPGPESLSRVRQVSTATQAPDDGPSFPLPVPANAPLPPDFHP